MEIRDEYLKIMQIAPEETAQAITEILKKDPVKVSIEYNDRITTYPQYIIVSDDQPDITMGSSDTLDMAVDFCEAMGFQAVNYECN